jgi:hypothetical protein
MHVKQWCSLRETFNKPSSSSRTIHFPFSWGLKIYSPILIIPWGGPRSGGGWGPHFPFHFPFLVALDSQFAGTGEREVHYPV